MKKIGLEKFRDANVENFTSDFGMDVRKKMNPLLRSAVKKMYKNIVVDSYPELEKGKPYIFASTHCYVDDATANISAIDRNAYILIGTTFDQLMNNNDVYSAWANGFMYVDRENPESRKDAVKKMKRVLDHGNSVLVFPEGCFNDTDNLLCQKLFASPYILAKMTGAEVVPIAPYKNVETGELHVNVGEPMNLAKYEEKKEALTKLRDSMATLLYENMENNAPRLIRNEMGNDPKLDYMEERRLEYLNTPWTRDVWDEEMSRYLDADDKEYMAVQESMENIKITKDNAWIMAPVLQKIEQEKRDNFNTYMHENWNKGKTRIKTR